MQVRAILFDYGMVLSGPADSDAYEDLIRATGLERDLFDQLYWTWRHEYDSGLLDGVGYWNKIAGDAGIDLDKTTMQYLIVRDVRMWSNINHDVVDWAIRSKKSGLIIGILSNMCLELADSIEGSLPWLKEFDHLFLSSRLRMAKPDPKLFNHVINALGIDPQRILFLDDREENVLAARQRGIEAIQFTTLDALGEQVVRVNQEAAELLFRTNV